MNVVEAVLDDPGEKYLAGGLELARISTVLVSAGLLDYSQMPPDKREYYLRRGTYVHSACEFHDKGTLNESTLSPVLRGRLQGWKKFRRETGFVPERIEWSLADLGGGYGGTLDRYGIFKELKGCPKGIVDLKSGSVERWVGYQTAAQARLVAGGIATSMPRFGVQLKDNGTYSLREFKDSYDFTVWAAALTIHRAKEAGR